MTAFSISLHESCRKKGHWGIYLKNCSVMDMQHIIFIFLGIHGNFIFQAHLIFLKGELNCHN
jgi:hypothetical protein